ncbi:MAG: acyl-ACP--UDP-N-acetylglucosamine O-acyltransferase [Bacteroidales bacterium]|nr:MAG: acyl-ACP--UDP-N-acetylglucosamine O-acyltransferase [Bacteroidales bacterium]
MNIHSSAEVHPDARIGNNVEVGPFSFIAKNVVIGDNTWIGPNVTIMDGSIIGSNCRIFPGTVIAGIPQDPKFAGEITTAEIGNYTTLREYVTVNRGSRAKGKTTIGDYCHLMAYVHIAHDCIVGNHCVIANCVNIAGEVVVFDWATIGGMSGIHQFSRVGAHSMISGLSKMNKDVPPYVKAGRDPISYLRLNIVGLKRRGFAPEKINEIQDIYRIIFQQGRNTSRALDFIERNFRSTPERDEILRFIRDSKRGIIKGYKTNR